MSHRMEGTEAAKLKGGGGFRERAVVLQVKMEMLKKIVVQTVSCVCKACVEYLL